MVRSPIIFLVWFTREPKRGVIVIAGWVVGLGVMRSRDCLAALGTGGCVNMTMGVGLHARNHLMVEGDIHSPQWPVCTIFF